jgi:hypothetical protein
MREDRTAWVARSIIGVEKVCYKVKRLKGRV